MRLYKTKPCPETYFLAMKSCAKSQDLNTCYDIRQELIRDLPGSEKDPRLDATMIECLPVLILTKYLAYGYAKDVASAERLFHPIMDMMRSRRQSSDARVLNSMLRCYVENGEDSKAERIFDTFVDLEIPRDFDTYDCMMDLLSRKPPNEHTFPEALDLWREIQLHCVIENKILPKVSDHRDSWRDVDVLRFKLQGQARSGKISLEHGNCRLLDYLETPEISSELLSRIPRSYIPMKDTVRFFMQRHYLPHSTTYASFFRVFANHMTKLKTLESYREVTTEEEREALFKALMPVYVLFRDYSRAYFPSREALDAVIRAHINSGDYIRALEWYVYRHDFMYSLGMTALYRTDRSSTLSKRLKWPGFGIFCILLTHRCFANSSMQTGRK